MRVYLTLFSLAPFYPTFTFHACVFRCFSLEGCGNYLKSKIVDSDNSKGVFYYFRFLSP